MPLEGEAEEIAVGRRFLSETKLTGEEVLKEDTVLGLFLMQSLCSSGPKVRAVEIKLTP